MVDLPRFELKQKPTDDRQDMYERLQVLRTAKASRSCAKPEDHRRSCEALRAMKPSENLCFYKIVSSQLNISKQVICAQASLNIRMWKPWNEACQCVKTFGE